MKKVRIDRCLPQETNKKCLTLQFKDLENEEKMKPKASRRKKINTKAEINEIATTKKEKSMKLRNGSLKR